MNETLQEKIDIIQEVKNFLMNEGLSNEEAKYAILDAEIIPMFEWDCNHDCIRSVEDYAAEAYEYWKAKQE